MTDEDTPESARRARLAFDALTRAADAAGIGVSIAHVTSDGAEIVYVNDASARLLGVALPQLSERPVWSFIAEDELPRLLAMHEQRLRGEPVPDRFETIVVRSDGTRVPVEIATTRVDLDGRASNVTFMFDISHRKGAEDALRRSEERFRALAEGAPDGMVILRWPVIAYANRRAAQLLGAESPAQVVGESMLDYLTPSHATLAEDHISRRQRGESLTNTTEYVAGGRTIEVSATPIEYDGSQAVLGFARDITERKAMVARLMESEKLAALGTLVAGVAHEINNPLAYLLLNLELLQRQLPMVIENPAMLPDLLKRIEEAKQGGDRVKTIVRDLQTVARRDDGAQVPVMLDGAIDAALSIVAHELRHPASVVRRFEPVAAVLGNATRFEQLFLNLVINAAHAIAEVEPERRVIEVAITSGPKETVVATIGDRGTGMAAATLARAMEPFFTTKPIGVGTGLGLPICQGIVRSAGGEIEIVSEPGHGTTVIVTLPGYRPRT